MNATVTLGVVVRDLAALVPGFLESVRGLWDELIVVDLGSTDGTPELFASGGARIIHHAPEDDLAGARNVVLAVASGDWVLMLDADERVSPAFVREFLGRCDEPSLGAVVVRVSSGQPYGLRRESWALRGLRRDAELRYRAPLHEDCSASVAAVLARTGRTIERLDAHVDHLGDVRARDGGAEQRLRQRRALERRVARGPGELESHLKLLEHARAHLGGPAFRDTAVRAHEALDRFGDAALPGAPWGAALVALIADGLFRPGDAAGLAFLTRWEPRLVPGAPFFRRRAEHHEALGDAARAEADYRRCLELGELLGDEQDSRVRPRLGLARLCISRRAPSEALEHARAALDAQPGDRLALFVTAALQLQLEGLDGLRAWGREHARAFGHSAAVAWAMGDAALSLGYVQASIGPLREAAGVPPAGAPALRLAQALLADGQLEAAARLTGRLAASETGAELGLLVFDLLEGRATEDELRVNAASPHGPMREWVDALARANDGAWLAAVRSNARAVTHALPWLEGYLRRAS